MFRQILSQHLIIFLVLWILWQLWPSFQLLVAAYRRSPDKPERKKPELKPRSPDDCTLCRHGDRTVEAPEKREVIPWSQVKGPAGRRKKSYSEGHACPKPDCDYFRITDMRIHALVSNGVKVGKFGDYPQIVKG